MSLKERKNKLKMLISQKKKSKNKNISHQKETIATG